MFGVPLLDPIGGLVVSGMILQSSWGICSSSIKELMDANVSHDSMDRVRELAAQMREDGVRDVLQIRSRKMGPYDVMDVELAVSPLLSVSAGFQLAEALKHRVLSKDNHISDVVIHVVPANLKRKGTKEQSALEQSPKSIEADVRQLIHGRTGVLGVSHVTVHYLGDSCLIQVEITVDPDQTVREAQIVAYDAEQYLRHQLCHLDAIIDVHLETNLAHVAANY